MSNEIMQENTPFVECSAFHRGMSVLEASLRNTEDSEAIISGLLKGAAEFYGASRASVVEADWDLGIGVITYVIRSIALRLHKNRRAFSISQGEHK